MRYEDPAYYVLQGAEEEEYTVVYEYYEDENLPIEKRQEIEDRMRDVLKLEFYYFQKPEIMPTQHDEDDMESNKGRYGYKVLNQLEENGMFTTDNSTFDYYD